MNVEIKCKWCKKPKTVREADVKRGWGVFCSKKCKAKEQEKRTHQNSNYKREILNEHEKSMEESTAGWDAHKEQS